MTFAERPAESEPGARLEAVWGEVTSLPEEERRSFLDTRVTDPGLRYELEALLAHAPRAEVFFAGLSVVVREAVQSLAPTPGAPLEEPPSDPLLGQVVGHYHIEATLGVGGMGVVYRARDTRLERTVALKFLPPSLSGDAEARHRFLAEARAAAALDHPNICNIHEIGVEDRPFIAMAFYSGETLKRILERGPLPVDVALDYAAQIARGLADAHRQGIVHRDVKPANVIVTPAGVVKLLDFGIASTSVPGASEPGVIPGTIAYMSPEQILSHPVDHRSDLWALGVVLYEMCAGARPFVGQTSVATLHAVLNDRLALDPAVRDRVGPGVVALLDRMLEKNPADRYADAEELIRALRDRMPESGPERAAALAGGGKRGRPLGVFFGFAVVAAAVALTFPALRQLFVAGTPRLGRETTRSSAARDLFDQASVPGAFRSDSSAAVALELLQRAVEIDTAFAGAHAQLAMTFSRVLPVALGPTSRAERLDSLRVHALRAVELDDSLPAALNSLGTMHLIFYEFQEAEAAFERELEFHPASWSAHRMLGHLRMFEGRFDDALEEFQQAWRDDPASSEMIAEVARGHLLHGRCDDEWLLQLEAVDPPVLWGQYVAAECHARNGRWEEALAILRVGLTSAGSQRLGTFGQMLGRASRLGPQELRTSRGEEARTILDTLRARVADGRATAFDVATVYSGLGELDPAFEWLERAVPERSVTFSIMHPAFEALHRDPRFAALRAEMGLPAWQPRP